MAASCRGRSAPDEQALEGGVAEHDRSLSACARRRRRYRETASAILPASRISGIASASLVSMKALARRSTDRRPPSVRDAGLADDVVNGERCAMAGTGAWSAVVRIGMTLCAGRHLARQAYGAAFSLSPDHAAHPRGCWTLARAGSRPVGCQSWWLHHYVQRLKPDSWFRTYSACSRWALGARGQTPRGPAVGRTSRRRLAANALPGHTPHAGQIRRPEDRRPRQYRFWRISDATPCDRPHLHRHLQDAHASSGDRAGPAGTSRVGR